MISNKTIYKITSTSRYRKDYKNLIEKGKDLPEKYHDHKLTGQWKGYRECPIQPDWL